ncbi:MAG: GDSL-type esterase/lipase family protein [Candidatus Marinimicrobia bacterium]|jgi:lysophospholipase L1-like esterase|nr:GDSL-type esterase/lipase family protein [Candidatus Neomarinimicrobiota bacterium]MDD5710258.1 GDSL-type esterase/lipase family protein [Candidatus Neomarinimicrobiota bacterium]
MIKNPLFSIALISIFLFSSCQLRERNIRPLNDYAHWHERMAVFINEKDSIREGSAIFFGNSITEGFDLKAFFPEWNTVNRGIVSDHIDGLIIRMDVCLGNTEQAKLFILIGINDIGAGRSEKEIKYLYRKMLRQIAANYDYDVYLHSILPTSPRWKNCPPEMIKNLNCYIEKLAKRQKMTFVNLYPLFKSEDSDFANAALFRDGLHPNREGYRLWAEHLRAIVK